MRSVLSTAVLAAAAMAGMGQSADVMPAPEYNKRGLPKGRRPTPQRLQRLERATGPGSLNERNEMFALIEAGKPQEAAEYYRRCLNINYRAGKPKLHRDMVTWYAYYN